MAIFACASVDITDGKANVVGRIDVGLRYHKGERPSMFREDLLLVGQRAARGAGGIDEDDAADGVARHAFRLIGERWARERFVEVWRGMGSDARLIVRLTFG